MEHAVGHELADEQDGIQGALRAELAVEVLGDLLSRAPGRPGATLEHRAPHRLRLAGLRRADHRRGTRPGKRPRERRTGLAALVPAMLAPFSPPSSVLAAQMEGGRR